MPTLVEDVVGSFGGANRLPVPWVRPTDWTALPTIGTQEFQGLVAVTDDEVNYLAMNCTLVATTANVINSSNDVDAATFETAKVGLRVGVLYLLSVETSHGTSATAVSAITGTAISGGGSVPTFTSRGTTLYNSNLNRVTVLSAVPTADYDGTLILNFGGTTQTGAIWSLTRIVGANTATNDGVVQAVTATGNSGTAAVTLAAFGAGTNGTFAAQAHASTNASAAGSGWTEYSDTTAATPAQALQTEWRKDNDTSVDATFTSAQWGIVGIEIKAAATLGDSTTTLQYHVDWGDGTTSDVGSAAAAEHLYTYADTDLANTECFSHSNDYRAVTFQDAGDTVTFTAHGLANAAKVRFSVITTTTGIVVDTTYFVVGKTANTFQVEASVGSGALPLTTNGTGTLFVSGYRQTIVRVTPATGCVFTVVNVQVKHTATNLQAYSARWLDIGLKAATVATFAPGGTTVYLADLEQVTIGSHSLTTMASAFSNCYSLISIPLFNTASVTSMTSTFDSCRSLTTVPLFNTASVSNMTSMFSNCTALVSVPQFNTAAVTTMNLMFSSCSALTTVPLFNTALVNTMASMFSNCWVLTTVPLFNTASVTSMVSMFASCFFLTTVPLFNTAAVTVINSMFSGCSALVSVPLFNTAAVTGSMVSMFSGCSALVSFPLFNTATVTTMASMFSSCTSLQSVPQFNTASVTNMNSMFSSCTSLVSVPLFNTAAVVNMGSMVNGCRSLTSIPAFVASAVTTGNFAGMVATCTSLAKSLMTGGKFTIDYTSCKLSKTAIETIFDNLGIASSGTITVTTNLGSPTATSKASSGTTSGSAVVTLANTSSLVTGMEVTGTGISDTLSVTFQDAGDTVTFTAHGIANATPVSFSVITTTTGIVINTIYYVVSTAANTFQVAATVGGSALPLTTDGTGTLRRTMTIQSIVASTSFTLNANCSATGSVTSTHTALLRWKATHKAWTVVT